jgi:hypothetical protein
VAWIRLSAFIAGMASGDTTKSGICDRRCWLHPRVDEGAHDRPYACRSVYIMEIVPEDMFEK